MSGTESKFHPERTLPLTIVGSSKDQSRTSWFSYALPVAAVKPIQADPLSRDNVVERSTGTLSTGVYRSSRYTRIVAESYAIFAMWTLPFFMLGIEVVD